METNWRGPIASFALVGVLALSACSNRNAIDANLSGGASSAVAAGAAGGTGVGGGAGCSLPSAFQWSSSGVFLCPTSDATHDLSALKDPTIVFYDDKWHVYATSVGPKGYGMVYMSLPDLAHPAAATTYYMDQTPGFAGYHVAPQLFFFRPQNKWYLVYQSGPPQYSTSDDPGTPSAWTRPASFFSGEPPDLARQQRQRRRLARLLGDLRQPQVLPVLFGRWHRGARCTEVRRPGTISQTGLAIPSWS